MMEKARAWAFLGASWAAVERTDATTMRPNAWGIVHFMGRKCSTISGLLLAGAVGRHEVGLGVEKTPFDNRNSNTLQQPEHEPEVVKRHQPGPQKLSRPEKMAQVGPRIRAAHRAGTGGIE